MARPTRKERERERRQSEVLEAAEAVFADKGFHDATVQEIAERAEFSVGSLYNMFEGKTELYYKLVEMRAEQYADQVRSSIEGLSDTLQKINAIIEAKIEFFDRNQRFFQIFARATGGEQQGPPLGISRKARAIYRGYMELVGGVLEQGIREGVLVDIDPLLATALVEGMTNAIIGHCVHTGGERLSGVTPEQLQRVLLHGILAAGDHP